MVKLGIYSDFRRVVGSRDVDHVVLLLGNF